MQNSKVFITHIGAHTAAGIGVEPLFSVMENKIDHTCDLVEFGLHGRGSFVDKNKLKSFEMEGKGMMSLQSQLTISALLNCIANFKNLDCLDDYQGEIYAANGAISLETRTIKSLINYLLDDENETLNYYLLAQNIEKLPPLDGIKMLSTAATHFSAKILDVHGPGQPLYAGQGSSGVALVQAFKKIRSGYSDFAVIVSAETPFFSHTYSYLSNIMSLEKNNILLGEGGFAVILQSEKMVKNSLSDPIACIMGGYNSLYPRCDVFNSLEINTDLVEHISHSLAEEKIDPITLDSCYSSGLPKNCEATFLNSTHFGFNCISSISPHLGFFGASSTILDVILCAYAIFNKRMKKSYVFSAGSGGFLNSIFMQETK